MGITAGLLCLSLTFAAPSQTGKMGVFFRKGQSEPCVGRVVHADASGVTVKLLPGWVETHFPKDQISEIQFEGSDRFNRYLQEYRILSQCIWLLPVNHMTPTPGYVYDPKNPMGVWLVYEADKGWVEWRPAEKPFEKGKALTGSEVAYMLGAVPGYNAKQLAPVSPSSPAPDKPSGLSGTDEACPVCQGATTVPCPQCRAGIADVPCPACKGSGRTPCESCKGSGQEPCPGCRGSGKVTMRSLSGSTWSKPCEKCRGSGKAMCDACDGRKDVRCRTCKGKKTVRQSCEACGGTDAIPCPECAKATKSATQKTSRSSAVKNSETVVGSLIIAQRLDVLTKVKAMDLMLEKLAGFKASLDKGLAAFEEAQITYNRLFRDKSALPLRNLLKNRDSENYQAMTGLFKKCYSTKDACAKASRWAADKIKQVQGLKQVMAGIQENPASGSPPQWYPRSMVAYMEKHQGKPAILTANSGRLADQVAGALDWAGQLQKQKNADASFQDMIRDSLKVALRRHVRTLELENGVLNLVMSPLPGNTEEHWREVVYDASSSLFPVYGEIHHIKVNERDAFKSGLTREGWQQERRRRDQLAAEAAAKNRTEQQATEQKEEEEETSGMVALLMGGIVVCLGLLFFVLKITGRKDGTIALQDPDDNAY